MTEPLVTTTELFSRFTQPALLAAVEANKIAERYKQTVSPDHLLLGLLSLPDAHVTACLVALNVDIEQLKKTVEQHLASSLQASNKTDRLYSAETKTAFEICCQEANLANAAWIDTKYILIGIVAADNSYVAKQLLKQVVSAGQLRQLLPLVQEHIDLQFSQSLLMGKELPTAPKRLTNWDRFAPNARLILSKAQTFSAEYNQESITPEHVLLGILDTPEANAYHCLVRLQINVEDLQQSVRAYLACSAKSELEQNILLSEEVKRVLEFSVEEARFASADYIDSTFLLLGLLHEGKSFSVQELRQRGVTVATVSKQPKRSQETEYPEVFSQQLKSTDGLINRIVFPLLLLAMLAAGYLTVNNPFPNSLPVFLFVAFGWLISLCLHEFGHAFVAYKSGDHSVKQKGYLTLNPIRYTHPVLSILLPMLFLIAGGLGLPGGAVYINEDLIYGRYRKSLVSAAGPMATAVVGLICATPFILRLDVVLQTSSFELWAALSLLAYLQISALCLTLLPIPGLDGYGLIEPFLPNRFRTQVLPLKQYMFLILIALFYVDTPFRATYWQLVDTLSAMMNIPEFGVQWGYNLFRFWQG